MIVGEMIVDEMIASLLKGEIQYFLFKNKKYLKGTYPSNAFVVILLFHIMSSSDMPGDC